jgi:hypothetical protein
LQGQAEPQLAGPKLACSSSKPCSGNARTSIGDNGKALTRANTDLYYANGGSVDDLVRAAEGAANGGSGAAANGHAHGGTPRGKPPPRYGGANGGEGGEHPHAHLAPPHARHYALPGTETEAMLSEDNAAGHHGLPGRLRALHEVSESEAGALAGRNEHRPAHIYAGPAERSNQVSSMFGAD